MQQVHRRKQRVLGKDFVIGRIAQAVFLDHAAAIELAPRLLSVTVRHPVLIEVVGQTKLVKVDHLAGERQIRCVRAIFIDQPIVEEHLLRARFIRRAHGVLQQRRLHRIVRIDERNVLSARYVKPRVSRGGQAAVLLVQQADTRVPRRVSVHDGRATVTCAVIHQNQLEIPEGLRQDAVKTRRQIGLHLIHRHNHAYPAHAFLPAAQTAPILRINPMGSVHYSIKCVSAPYSFVKRVKGAKRHTPKWSMPSNCRFCAVLIRQRLLRMQQPDHPQPPHQASLRSTRRAAP